MTSTEGSAAPRTNVYKDTVFTSNEAPPSKAAVDPHESKFPPHTVAKDSTRIYSRLLR